MAAHRRERAHVSPPVSAADFKHYLLIALIFSMIAASVGGWFWVAPALITVVATTGRVSSLNRERRGGPA